MAPAIMKAPLESVATGEVSSAVGVDPLPDIPAAYNCTLEPTIGNTPALTVPLIVTTG